MSRKKFCIITEYIGKSAPGIVFERLISEISQRHVVDVVCLKNNSSITLKHVQNILEVDDNCFAFLLKPKVKFRISKYSVKFLKYDIGAKITSSIMARLIRTKIVKLSQYNYIFSMISFGHLSPLLLAETIKKTHPTITNLAYFVDAVPAPLGWSIDNSDYRGLKVFVSERMKALDVLFSSNEQMLNYQLSVAGNNVPTCKAVLFNPALHVNEPLPSPPTDRYNFLYTGGIYGRRTAKYVLQALKIILKKFPTVYLVFVGTVFDESEFLILSEIERTHVVIHPFANDLTPFYADATALIDIDAQLENDVFLSSKIINYLMVDRIIISETGKNSPSKMLFSGLISVYQCTHDPEEIAQCMSRAIQFSERTDYSERDDLKRIFSVQSVIDTMDNALGL